MREVNDVTIVVPCRNEAGSLPELLAAVPRGYQVIVVDNGSTDETAEVAARCGAQVVTEQTPGYGAAVHAGVVATRTTLLAVLDGDGSLDPGELPTLVASVRAGADLAVGRRRLAVGTAGANAVWPWHARLGNSVVAWRLRAKHKVPVHDIAPMRVVRTEALRALNVTDRRFGYPLELLVRAGAAGWQVTEHDISYRSRTAGTSKVSGSVLGSARAARDFLRVLS